MKKNIAAILPLAVSLTLAGCGANNIDADALASKLVSEGEFAEQLTEVSDAVAGKRLFLAEEDFEDCAAYAGTAAVTDEVVVIKTNDTAKVEEAVKKYIDKREETYSSYRPDEVPKLRDAVVRTIDGCVIMCVSENPDAARKIIDGYTK